jgi:hypothetical protein
MVTKFNTSAPASASSSSSSSSGGSNTVRNVLIVVGLLAAGYFAYRFISRKKQETVVYVDESEDY